MSRAGIVARDESPAVLLTVAVCTRNRAASLHRALASLTECARPSDGSWEVVVVDNGSTDDTLAICAGYGASLPLRVVREDLRGLAHARNAAVRSARGEYLLWTDDDCVLDQRWLIAYAAAFQRWPDAAVFGGPIVPRFEGNPPTWLTRVAARVGTAYAARDFGTEEVALSIEDHRIPFGANYAIRASEQRGRLYDPRLGRGSELPMTSGEESDVLRGLLRAGARGRWVPDAVVTHCIPPERQRLAYLREYFAADGAYEEWRRHSAPNEMASDDLSRFQLFRRAVRSELRYQILRRVSRPEAWIDDLIAASVARGRARAKRAIKRR